MERGIRSTFRKWLGGSGFLGQQVPYRPEMINIIRREKPPKDPGALESQVIGHDPAQVLRFNCRTAERCDSGHS
jgi:hypothetical protein